MSAVQPKWDALGRELSSQVEALLMQNQRSTKEAAAWVPWDEWLAVERRLASTEFGSPQHLLVACLCLWPPLRGGDLGAVNIDRRSAGTPASASANALAWGGSADQPAELHIGQHKTSHIYGPLHRNVPLSLKKIIAASLALQPRDALFVSLKSGQPFSAETVYTSWANRTLARIFGRPVTTNTARHAFVSALDTSKMSTAQLAAIAKSMGHSVKQQRNYFKLDQGAPVLASIHDGHGELCVPMRAATSPAAPRDVDLDSEDLAFPVSRENATACDRQ